MKKLYLAVDTSPYELPLFVTDTVVEMAKKYGTTESNISSKISHGHKGREIGVTFLRIELEDE